MPHLLRLHTLTRMRTPLTHAPFSCQACMALLHAIAVPRRRCTRQVIFYICVLVWVINYSHFMTITFKPEGGWPQVSAWCVGGWVGPGPRARAWAWGAQR